MADFGTLVKERRESLGLTRTDLALMIGLDSTWTSYISRIEAGETTPNLTRGLAILAALSIDPSEVW